MTQQQSAAGSGGDRLKDTAQDAREKAAERAAELKQDTRDMVQRAKAGAEAEAERVKGRGAGRLRDLSHALGRAADDLGHESPSGSMIREAADGLDEVARSIERRSVGEIVDTVADFGRRNPTVFLGGAMLAGFALSRFATASNPSPLYDDRHHLDRHFEYDRPAGSSASHGTSVSRDPGSGADRAARPAPGMDDQGERPDGPLTLKPSMQLGASEPSGSGTHRSEGGAAISGTSSAVTGKRNPDPSAGSDRATPKEDRT